MRPGPPARRRLADGNATTPCRCEQRPIPWTQEMGRCFLARYRPNVFSEGARTAKRRFPGKIFAGCIPQQRFSLLFTAQIIHNKLILPKTGRSSMHFSVPCHEEVFLPSRAPLRMHDGHSLPLLDAQPFHAGHPEGHLAGGSTPGKGGRLAGDPTGCKGDFD